MVAILLQAVAVLVGAIQFVWLSVQFLARQRFSLATVFCIMAATAVGLGAIRLLFILDLMPLVAGLVMVPLLLLATVVYSVGMVAVIEFLIRVTRVGPR